MKMDDWKAKLEGLGKALQSQERAEQEQKAAVLAGFRKALKELEPVCRTAADFGNAFGADLTYVISRFDDRYPYLRLKIKKPLMEYEVTCREGVLFERTTEGGKPPFMRQTTLEQLQPGAFADRLNQWVQSAASANRKVPGRR